MKLVKKLFDTPPLLLAFATTKPTADWDKFKKNQVRYKQVVKQVQDDQGGICAYCEIDFLDKAVTSGTQDFRVEHFHPKSPHSPPPNWSLDWRNLLGTCHGGSQRDVSDPTRFTAPDVCCDVPKGKLDLTNQILNPLSDIPAFPRLFKFSETSGEIGVDSVLCPSDKITKAEGSMKMLNLNAPRLNRMRHEILRELGDQIDSLMESGMSAEDAAIELARAMFSDSNLWPAFFTCVRWYLGPAAESQLLQIGYAG